MSECTSRQQTPTVQITAPGNNRLPHNGGCDAVKAVIVETVLHGYPIRQRGVQLEEREGFLKMADRPEPVEVPMAGESRGMLLTREA